MAFAALRGSPPAAAWRHHVCLTMSFSPPFAYLSPRLSAPTDLRLSARSSSSMTAILRAVRRSYRDDDTARKSNRSSSDRSYRSDRVDRDGRGSRDRRDDGDSRDSRTSRNRSFPSSYAANKASLPGRDPRVAARVTERRHARLAAPKPTFKILRGKKDITEDPLSPPKSRKARFFDPEDSFGKRSLVYQMKTGQLGAELDHLQEETRKETRPRRDRDGGDPMPKNEFFSQMQAAEERETRRRERRPERGERNERGERDDGYEGRWVERERSGRSRWERRVQTARRPRPGRFDPDQDRGRPDRPGRRPENNREPEYRREPKYEREPKRRESHSDSSSFPPPAPTSDTLSIPYTTAASQFLYGRSVVEAALRSGRRKLYKLFVSSSGDSSGSTTSSRPDTGKTSAQMLERLARRRDVPSQTVDAAHGGQRLLDKMSKGRPHNGCVLEASPLPQPPVLALGAVTLPGMTTAPEADAEAEAGAEAKAETETEKMPGFHTELGYQSREDATVNGTDTFVPLAATTAGPASSAPRYPLVLLLDQVLDPGNLGAILRSADFLGVHAVAVSRHSSASLTPVALKASAGAAEEMRLWSVETPATFLARSQEAGWQVYAATVAEAAEEETPGRQKPTAKPVMGLADLERDDPLARHPCILVLGSEGEGLPRAIRRTADVHVCIANRSGSAVVDSLNVSVATGLLCASFLRGQQVVQAASSGGQDGSEEPGKAERLAEEAERREKDELGIWA